MVRMYRHGKQDEGERYCPGTKYVQKRGPALFGVGGSEFMRAAASGSFADQQVNTKLKALQTTVSLTPASFI